VSLHNPNWLLKPTETYAVQVDGVNYQTQLLAHLLDLGYSCSVMHGEVVVTCLRGEEYNVRKAIKDFVEKQKEEIHDGI